MTASVSGTIVALFFAVGVNCAKADMSSIPPDEQEKDHPGCKVVNSATRISPKQWNKSNNQVDPDLNDTTVGYWLGPCLTWHTTGLHPTGNEKSIGLATLASETRLPKGEWRLTGKYSADGTTERKVSLQIFQGSVGPSPLSKPSVLTGRGGDISTAFTLATEGSVTLLLRSECHNSPCWGELNDLKFTKQ